MLRHPYYLAFFCGFASLSSEILWVRLFGFAQQSTPQAFGFILFCFILGIAIGAHIGKRICEKEYSDDHLWHLAAIILIVSSLIQLSTPILFSSVKEQIFQSLAALILVPINAIIISVLFPVVHHLGAENKGEKQGRLFSNVYFFNVMGAALGPIFTGYVLLDIFTLQQAFILLAALTTGFGVVLLKLKFSSRSIIFLALIANSAFIFPWNPSWLIQKLNITGENAKYVVETRQGVITIFESNKLGDSVYGGNVYDGRVNLDGDINSNSINRILLTSVLQPHPKKVLMIGLSIGTWLALVREFPEVEGIDVIEINPGYKQAISHYPDQTQAINDRRVNIYYDDARRWLKNHPDKEYDLIIMNTTWHWRSYISLLLSQDFMKIIKNHMKSRAIFCFNTTDSKDAFYTSASVFSYAYKYHNFVYTSDHDFRKDKDTELALSTFKNIKIIDKPIFKRNSDAPRKMLALPFVSIDDIQKNQPRALEVITDINMITEFKYGRKLFE